MTINCLSLYLVENSREYVLSSLVASLDGEWRFLPYTEAESAGAGCLEISMAARLVINDGQHRRAAIGLALRECPELGDDTLPVLIYPDPGLENAGRMFLDMAKTAAIRGKQRDT